MYRHNRGRMVNLAAQIEGPANVRRVFRMLVRQAKRLPVSVSNSALEELRQGFRTGGGGTGSEQDTAEILRRAEDRLINYLTTHIRNQNSQEDSFLLTYSLHSHRLGFIKIVTRREVRDDTFQKGRQTFVYGSTQNGQPTSSRKPLSNWSGNNLDPDSVSMHKQTLNRAGFSNHDQVLGPQGF